MGPEYKKILIVKPSSLGDIIHALPALSALRKKFPRSWIAWVVKEEYKEILLGNPMLNEVLTIRKGLLGWLTAAKRLRGECFDLAIDFQGLFRSAWLAWWSRATERIGFSAARECGSWFYTTCVGLPGEDLQPWRLLDVHAVDRNLAIVRQLGANVESVSFDLPPLPDDQNTNREWLEHFGIAHDDRVVVMAPGGRLPIKRWPVERFAMVAQTLCRENEVKIVVIGSSADQKLGEIFHELLNSQCINLIGKTRLKQLGVLLNRAHLLIANDSAPVHFAVACRTPVLAITGPTNSKATGPYPFGKEKIIRQDLPCSPCGKKQCRNPRYMECLTSISVDEVAQAAQEMLLTN